MEEFGLDGLDFSFEELDGLVPDEETVDQEQEDESTSRDEGDGENITDSVDDTSEEVAEDESSEEVGDDDAQDEGGTEGSSSDLYSSLASFVYEQGLLPSMSADGLKDIKDVDAFTKALRTEQEAQSKVLLDEYIRSLDINSIGESRSIIDNVSQFDENYLKDNLHIAKELIKEDFKNQGLNENQISRIINKLVDLGDEDLVNEALTSKDSLIEIQRQNIETQKQNYERERAENIRKQEELQTKIKSSVYDSKSILEGYQATPALRDAVYKTMTTSVAEDANGNQLNKFMKDRADDPIGFETRLYYAYVLTDGFKSIKNLGGSAKSSAVKDLEKTLKNTNFKQDSTPAYVKDNNSYFGEDFEIQF